MSTLLFLSLGQWAREREVPPRPRPLHFSFLLVFSCNADRIEKVTRIEGVFSGTLSYIFNEFSTGSADGPAFSTVVRTARDKGYTVCLSSSFTSHLRDRTNDQRTNDRPLFPLCPSDVPLLFGGLA